MLLETQINQTARQVELHKSSASKTNDLIQQAFDAMIIELLCKQGETFQSQAAQRL